MRKLFIDDERFVRDVYPGDIGWITVRSFQKLDLILNTTLRHHNVDHNDFDISKIEMISFDHDLGFEEEYRTPSGLIVAGKELPNGSQCATIIIEKLMDRIEAGIPCRLEEVRVHSMNESGANNIMSKFQSFATIFSLNIKVVRVRL